MTFICKPTDVPPPEEIDIPAMKQRATRPPIAAIISPVTLQASCASQATVGATSSGSIGGYCEMSSPSAMRVTALGTMTLDFTLQSSPSSAAMLLSPIMPDFEMP